MQVSRTYVQFVKEKPRVLKVASFDCCSSKPLILSLYWKIGVRGSSVSCKFYAVQRSKVIKRSKKYHFRLRLMPLNLEMTQFIFRHKTSISVQHLLNFLVSASNITHSKSPYYSFLRWSDSPWIFLWFFSQKLVHTELLQKSNFKSERVHLKGNHVS